MEFEKCQARKTWKFLPGLNDDYGILSTCSKVGFMRGNIYIYIYINWVLTKCKHNLARLVSPSVTGVLLEGFTSNAQHWCSSSRNPAGGWVARNWTAASFVCHAVLSLRDVGVPSQLALAGVRWAAQVRNKDMSRNVYFLPLSASLIIICFPGTFKNDFCFLNIWSQYTVEY